MNKPHENQPMSSTSQSIATGFIRRIKITNNKCLLLIEIDPAYQQVTKQMFENYIAVAIARLSQQVCVSQLQQQMIFSNKIQTAQERLIEIDELIQLHKTNIQLLHDFAQGKETLANRGCTDSAAQYQRTDEDNERYPWTIANLRWQIAMLEREREVLQHYVL